MKTFLFMLRTHWKLWRLRRAQKAWLREHCELWGITCSVCYSGLYYDERCDAMLCDNCARYMEPRCGCEHCEFNDGRNESPYAS